MHASELYTINIREELFMRKINKLDKYKPYNEFWFKDCLYHSLAQIVGNLGLINVLLKDERIYFESIVVGHSPKLSLEEHCEKGWIKCLQEYGLEVTFIDSKGDRLIDKIKKCIDNQCPVILPIDCFYEKMRSDTYMKKHQAHRIVIIGYNDKKHECDVLEHRYINDLKYINVTIPYEQIVWMYEGYWASNNKLEEESFISIDTSNACLFKDKLPIEEIIVTIETFMNSIQTLSDFVQLFRTEFVLNKMDDSLREEYANMFTEIVIKRRVLFALVEAIRKEFVMELNEMHIEALNNWTMIMAIMNKIKFSGRASQESIDRVVEILDKLCIQEKEWSNKMYNQLLDVLGMKNEEC